MAGVEFVPGQVFVVPMLGGGYAFGYITFYRKGGNPLVNIFDFVGEEPEPPEDITKKPVIIHDLFVGTEFQLLPRHDKGERWTLTKQFVEGKVSPRNRYYLMGGPPRPYRRIDILKEEPDVPLSPEEAKQYPAVSTAFPPTPAAQIEVAVKRLIMTPRDLIKSWRERKQSH